MAGTTPTITGTGELPLVWVSLVVLLALLVCGAARAQRVELPTRPGVMQPIYVTPAASPVAAAILFPGNSGVVSALSGNFLVRTAPQFAAVGITAVIADSPSDHSTGMADNFRSSAEHAQDVAAIVDWLKQRTPVPVWLVGTSNGTTSAANAAVRLGPSRIAGVVLTSAVWARGMRDTHFEQLRVPVLIVHNRDDGCAPSPFAGAERALTALTAAPARQFIAVEGGSLRGSPCEGKSPHGYFGIENQVVPQIAAWIKAH